MKYNLLFICTHNLHAPYSEGVCNNFFNDTMHGFSCGSNPSGIINPCALEVLTDLEYDTSSMRSKSWDEFTDSNVKIDISLPFVMLQLERPVLFSMGHL